MMVIGTARLSRGNRKLARNIEDHIRKLRP
ncbi:hypothetical protein J2R78_006706 [Bradyrhizobium sp. USDA 4538]|nr:hypothetical protein [Bradyrhizobium sp. USDA 4545]MCP1843739.1 hypothetical protein [Bradyrhizobium sp. USDA 4538]MCP1904305.1 hypothetical protein [Bradyrhizobium sp. USDA 4537]MCP1915145.1 hypothetical protein [Bradyrhizobium elkanii]MCP1917163.1 hypothetical protein [Bradyrhizobium sp. USDA 4532]MCP1990039.1 hypothetical protein [Bradyrhizobium sp. USDA 4539]